jgi:hypothetical protein
VDKLKVGKLVGALSLLLLSAYAGMFILDPLNVWVFFYLKAVALAVLPGLVCFSWLYFWRDGGDPFQFLLRWNVGSQILFLSLNLVRVQAGSWGFFGWLYMVLSVIIIGIYLTNLYFSKWGFWVTGVLILLNVVFAFGLALTTFEYVHPWFAREGVAGLAALRDFVTELSVMGVLFASSSQLYWHEILKKIREELLVEMIFDSLED